MFPILYTDDFLTHDTGHFHPENPGRLESITTALRAAPWANQLDWREPIDRDVLSHIHRVHDRGYVEEVAQLSGRGGGYLDGDTPLSPRSYAVALRAVAAWLDGVDIAWKHKQPVFVASRPPGHHACRAQGMGFCIFSNAAIAAFYALTLPGIDRVAILDWDVHHGNGTQEAVWEESKILLISIHQAPFYPGTGWQDEQGAHHNIVNLPLREECNGEVYLGLFQETIVPKLQQFSPDLLIVSAGFDANADDPLARMNLLPEDYGRFARLCLNLTPKVVFGLEGGYDYPSLSRSVCAVIESCLSQG